MVPVQSTNRLAVRTWSGALENMVCRAQSGSAAEEIANVLRCLIAVEFCIIISTPCLYSGSTRGDRMRSLCNCFRELPT